MAGNDPRTSATVTESDGPSAEAVAALGRGLESMAAGDWTSPLGSFTAADTPGAPFEPARVLAARAAAVVDALDQPLVAAIEDVVRLGQRQRAVRGLQAVSSGGPVVGPTVGPTDRAEAAELLGIDQLRGGALMRIVFGPGS